MSRDRTFDRAKDEHRIYCRHTALEPLSVIEDREGNLRVTSAQCGNCKAVLFEKEYTNRIAAGAGHE
jgi:hypothetical protein